jgi:hypothetical protein
MPSFQPTSLRRWAVTACLLCDPSRESATMVNALRAEKWRLRTDDERALSDRARARGNARRQTVVEIQQEIRAVILKEGHAVKIAAAPGSPALEITRRYFSTGRRLIQVSVNTIPADRFFYSVEILRQTAPVNS